MKQIYSALFSLITGLLTGITVRLLTHTSEYLDDGYLTQMDKQSSAIYNTYDDAQSGTDMPTIVDFDDGHLHNDDDAVAKKMAEDVRVLCWIMTSPKSLHVKAIHVKNTWGKRCNTMLFMSDEEDVDFPAVGLETEHGREHLTAKSMKAFDYLYKNHLNDADWFLKTDDDTYVIVENLRYMLSAHAPSEPIFFGHHFDVIVDQGYFSGGAGYVMSREALTRFGTREDNLCANDRGAEDVQIGRCMEKLGVKTGDSRDKLNRTRFHCFSPGLHLKGGYPDWYNKYDKYGAQQGIDSISDYPVSFHYVGAELMYDLEYMLYHLSTYGLVRGPQHLNKPTDYLINLNTPS